MLTCRPRKKSGLAHPSHLCLTLTVLCPTMYILS
jgi:hypothetical protein